MATGFNPWPLARPDSLVPGTQPGRARVWHLPGLGAHLRPASLWRSPWHGNGVISPGPESPLQGRPALSCPSGGQGARVQGLSLSFPWLSSGTELAFLPHSQGFPSTQTIPGRDQAGASWEPAQGFVPGSSGKRSRERPKVSQRRGRGRGPGPAGLSGETPGALERCEVPLQPRQFHSQWGLGRAGRPLSPPESTQTPGVLTGYLACRPNAEFHGNLRSQVPSKQLAWSQLQAQKSSCR